MASSIHVRTATDRDLAPVLDLLAQLHPDASEMPTGEEAQATWERILSESNRSVFVAEADGTICGTADLLVVANLTHHARTWSIVENLVVDECYRRRGIGRALLEAVIASAKSAGAYKVQLLSADGREAHRFYETLGFEPRAQGFRRYF